MHKPSRIYSASRFFIWKSFIDDKSSIKLSMITMITSMTNSRSSCPEVFCKKGVLTNFAKFTGKHLCQRLFFNKVAGLRPSTLLKKRLWHRCFPVNLAKFLRTPFSQNTSGGCFCNSFLLSLLNAYLFRFKLFVLHGLELLVSKFYILPYWFLMERDQRLPN